MRKCFPNWCIKNFSLANRTFKIKYIDCFIVNLFLLQWSKYSVAYALQTVAINIIVHEPTKDLTLTMEQLFSPGTVVFLLEPEYYGVKGVVCIITVSVMIS